MGDSTAVTLAVGVTVILFQEKDTVVRFHTLIKSATAFLVSVAKLFQAEMTVVTFHTRFLFAVWKLNMKLKLTLVPEQKL